MADKSFGVKELNLLNASGTPTVTSPNNLNLNANTVAISTSATVGNNLTVTSTTNSANLNVTGVGTLTRAFATDLSVSGVTTITVPANANPHSSWDVVNNSASAYRFTGPGQDGAEDNPNIYLVRGQRYVFKMNASGHPFQIRVSNGGSAYSDGVTNNGSQTGNVVFNVQHDAPAQLFYQCTSHGSMVGNIYIVGQHLANGVDERVLTATSAYGMTGHSTLVYDGTDLRNTAGDIVSASGSAGSPSHRSSDGNTGMFFPSADKLAFSTGGFSRVVIDDNDGMIIGNNQARATTDSGVGGKLTVGSGSNTGITIRSGTSSVGSLYFSDGTSGDDELRGLVQYNHTSNFLRFFADASERLRIDSSGRVLIGTTTEGFATYGDKLTIADSGHCGMTIRSGTSNYGTIYFSDADDGSADEVRGFLEYNHSTNALSLGSNASARLRIDSDGAVNIGSNPTQATGGNTQNAILTVKGYPSGETSAAILALVRGNNTTSTAAGHTLGRIVFSDKQAGEYAMIEGESEHNGAVGDTPGRLIFSTTGDGNTTPTEQMRIDMDGFVSFGGDGDTGFIITGTNTLQCKTNGTLCTEFAANQRVRMPQVYSTNGSSMRDVQIESDGTLCAGNTSIRASKKNITSQTDVSWLYDLNPVTFNYRKHTVHPTTGVNTYLEETLDETSYGLIAEEVESVNKDFCFYNDNKLEGVSYSQLITPLLKALQDQKREIETLKTKVATLEGS